MSTITFGHKKTGLLLWVVALATFIVLPLAWSEIQHFGLLGFIWVRLAGSAIIGILITAMLAAIGDTTSNDSGTMPLRFAIEIFVIVTLTVFVSILHYES
jgi:hypothetical protein